MRVDATTGGSSSADCYSEYTAVSIQYYPARNVKVVGSIKSVGCFYDHIQPRPFTPWTLLRPSIR